MLDWITITIGVLGLAGLISLLNDWRRERRAAARRLKQAEDALPAEMFRTAPRTFTIKAKGSSKNND